MVVLLPASGPGSTYRIEVYLPLVAAGGVCLFLGFLWTILEGTLVRATIDHLKQPRVLINYHSTDSRRDDNYRGTDWEGLLKYF